MTDRNMRPHPSLLLSSDQVYVDKRGNDTTGNGSIDNPFLTIGAAYTAAVVGDTIVVGPGTYSETLTIEKSVNFKARIEGTVTISANTLASATVQIFALTAGCTFDGINITNLNPTAWMSIAFLVDNTGNTITGPVYYKNGTLTGGTGNGSAYIYYGDNGGGGGVTVYIQNASTLGCLFFTGYTPADITWFKNVTATGGNAIYAMFDGTDGRVLMSNFVMPTATAGETISLGGNVATGVQLMIGSSAIAATLSLDNPAPGAGYTVIQAGSQVSQIIATEEDQIIQRWNGEDDLTIEIRNVNVNTGAPRDIGALTPAAGRTFAPYAVRTNAPVAVTGVALSYSVSGVGAMVAATGPAAHAQGCINETVLQETATNANPLIFSIVALSGAAGDEYLDVEIEGKYF